MYGSAVVLTEPACVSLCKRKIKSLVGQKKVSRSYCYYNCLPSSHAPCLRCGLWTIVIQGKILVAFLFVSNHIACTEKTNLKVPQIKKGKEVGWGSFHVSFRLFSSVLFPFPLSRPPDPHINPRIKHPIPTPASFSSLFHTILSLQHPCHLLCCVQHCCICPFHVPRAMLDTCAESGHQLW